MHRTKTGILRKIREIEASSMGVETVRGYNLDRPPGCNPKTRDHKQASIFVEFVDVFHLCPARTRNSRTAARPARGACGHAHTGSGLHATAERQRVLRAVHAAMRMPV
jgi:hypothetical protein